MNLSRSRFWGPNVPFSFYSLHSEICMMGEAWCIQSYRLFGNRGHGFILRPICPSPQILNLHDQKSDWPHCADTNGFDQSKHDIEVAIVQIIPKTIFWNQKSLSGLFWIHPKGTPWVSVYGNSGDCAVICQTLCFKRRLLLYIKKKEPNRTEPILTKTETNRLYLRTEPPIIPVSRNRNEPKRTGGFLKRWNIPGMGTQQAQPI